MPDKNSINPLLAPNKTVRASITPDITVLGYGVLGGAAPGSAPMTVTSSLDCHFDKSIITNPQHLFVGLLDPKATGSGFESLEFTILGQGVKNLFDQTFSSAALAQDFFNDRILDLGLLTDITGNDPT